MGIKIDRRQKNLMRSHIEEVVRYYKDLEEKIDGYETDTEPDEYRKFWKDLRSRNQEQIQVVSRYMVMKCNR
jgi:uncharacterized Zn finger protein